MENRPRFFLPAQAETAEAAKRIALFLQMQNQKIRAGSNPRLSRPENRNCGLLFVGGHKFFDLAIVFRFHLFVAGFLEVGAELLHCAFHILHHAVVQRVVVFNYTGHISNPHNYAESIGAVVIDTPRAALEDILKKCAVTERSYCYLVNEAGVLVAESDERRTEMMPEAAAAALQNGGVWRTAQRRVSVRAIDECSWALVQVVPEADLSKVRYAQVQAFVLCALAVLTVSCVLAVLMANGITRRINVLSGRMKAFRYEHSRQLPVPADGGDDIDRLMDSYNGLVGAVRTLSAENVRKGRQLNETELAMLYTQINPHFLFNTLDMIRYLADHNQNDKISAAMIALAQFYRKSLNGGRRMSTVRGELDHVRAYMQIQRLRFGDDVALRVDVPEALMNCPLPAVTLQPIVENALLHGILGRADKSGEIRITGEASGGEARITVRDDGCGMTAAQVAALFDESRAGGVGLRNTDTRLRMQFGAGCGLSVQSEEGEYTAVTVHLPPPRPDSEPPEQA